ncbi:MAG: NYN domain-containing protein [candidate division Zixibacteria bacterium]|nr:NYN domain-containing protein [candidate division Zixibacteria bacterium]
MSRVSVFIDGFNLYHSMMSDRELRKSKWLDLSRMANSIVSKGQTLTGIYYFTAYTPWDQAKRDRHKTYIRALEHSGVEVILGVFRLKPRKIKVRIEQRREVDLELRYNSFEEKRTDVNIAISLLKLAVSDHYDEAFIVSGDSDLVPAISEVITSYGKTVRIVIPPRQKAKELCSVATSRKKLQRLHFQKNQFPLTITPPKGPLIECPREWR